MEICIICCIQQSRKGATPLNPATAKAGVASQNLKKKLGAKLKGVAMYNSHRVSIFASLESKLMAIKQSTATYVKKSHQKDDDVEKRMSKFS